jgi:hypothetical protein
VKLLYHVAFLAEKPFDDAGAQAEPEDWQLPLYPYPAELKSNVARWLPHCLADWEGEEGPEETVGGITRRLHAPNVSFWGPRVVLVTQEVSIGERGAPPGFDELHDLVYELADWLGGTASPLDPVVRRAMVERSEHGVGTGLKGHALWAFGTALPGWGVPPAGEEVLEVGPLRMLAKEFACFVSYTTAQAPEELARFKLLMAVQNVIWAVAIDHDSALLEHIADLHPGRHEIPVRELERKGKAILSLSFDVAQLRGSVASMETHLMREAYRYWETMDEAWKLSGYLESITGKADALVDLHDRSVAQKTSARAKRLANAALLFTALGLVSVVVALEEFVLDKPDSNLLGAFAIGVIVVCVIAAGIVVRRLAREE